MKCIDEEEYFTPFEREENPLAERFSRKGMKEGSLESSYAENRVGLAGGNRYFLE